MDRKVLLALTTLLPAALGLFAGCGNRTGTAGSNASGSNAPGGGAGAPAALNSASAPKTGAPVSSESETPAGVGGVSPMSADVVQVASNDQRFSILSQAVQAAGLAETLKGAGPYTVFAPTDAAFRRLPEAQLEALLKPENKAKLATILRYHVVPNRVTSADVRALDDNTSLNTLGGALTVDKMDGGFQINDAVILEADIPASNGVLHAIDTVLIPATGVSSAAAAGGRPPAGPGRGPVPAGASVSP